MSGGKPFKLSRVLTGRTRLTPAPSNAEDMSLRFLEHGGENIEDIQAEYNDTNMDRHWFFREMLASDVNMHEDRATLLPRNPARLRPGSRFARSWIAGPETVDCMIALLFSDGVMEVCRRRRHAAKARTWQRRHTSTAHTSVAVWSHCDHQAVLIVTYPLGNRKSTGLQHVACTGWNGAL